MMKSWKLWVVLGLIAGMVGLFAFGFTTDPYKVQSPLLGKPAPDFTVKTLDGQTIQLSALRGKVVVLNFWGSWCAACREEARLLQETHVRYEQKAKTAMVLGIAMNDTPEQARKFAEIFGKTFSLALDNKTGDVAFQYGVYGAPETFFIDRQGMIRHKVIGAMTAEEVAKQMEQLTGEN
ncbi:MAG: TlpA family protein disulfide reductase [Deltaproteobacteria bacterium]|nr:TlpA family protein disulfide reductase [Deltaproteobacteria bacterium]